VETGNDCSLLVDQLSQSGGHDDGGVLALQASDGLVQQDQTRAVHDLLGDGQAAQLATGNTLSLLVQNTAAETQKASYRYEKFI
jgi:hypothetical protein